MGSSIIRFDHISKVMPRKGLKVAGNYKFCELGIKNTAGRYLFMDEAFSDIDMYFYDGMFPVEAVLYDYVIKESDVKLADNVIICRGDAEYINSIEKVFCIIGFKQRDKFLWNISGGLDKQDIYIKILIDCNVQIMPINWGGWNCPCFMVKSVDKLFKQVDYLNEVTISDINQLVVNGRYLDVGFLAVKGFELVFEFISLNRK